MKAAPRYAIEISAYNVGGATTTTLYYATAGFTTRPSETPANTLFDERVLNAVDIERWMFGANKTLGRSETVVGQVVLSNADGGLDTLNTYAFDGRTITVRRTDVYGAAYPSDYDDVFVGAIEGTPLCSLDTITFNLRTMDYAAIAPLQTTRYAGSNTLPAGLEGVPEDIGGKPKPVCFGVVKNVPAPCVNTSKLIYQVNDGAVASIDAVYDRGVLITNGVRNWTSQTSGFGGSSINAATYGNGLFVIAGASGKLSTSPDGVTWTSRTSGFSTTAIRGLTYGNGLFVAVGDAGTLTTSPDGTTWTARTSGFGATAINSVGYGSGLFVAVGDSGKLFTSSNGTTWTSRTSGFSTTKIAGVAFGARTWVTVGSTSIVASSPDGITWTVQSSASTPGGTNYVAVAYGDTAGFVAVGATGLVAISREGTGWNVQSTATAFGAALSIDAITYGNGLYVASTATGAGTTPVGYSDDGRLWTLIYQFSADSIATCAFGNRQFLVASTSGTLYTSYGTTTYASQADLLDDTLAPPLGTYGVYLAGGYFRLGGTPDGIVTADVTQGAASANRTTAQLANLVLARLTSAPSFDAGDVTTLDAADNSEVGYWTVDDGVTVGTVLDVLAGTLGASWYCETSGDYRLAQLLAPTGTAVLSLTSNDVTRLARVAPSDASRGVPTWKVQVRWGRYYQTIASDIAGAVTDEARAQFAQEWRDVTSEDSSVLTAYPSSQVLVIESLYSQESDAQAEADRVLALRKVKRDLFDCTAELNDESNALDLNGIVSITHSRYGLSGGASFRALGIRPATKSNRVTITAWGHTS